MCAPTHRPSNAMVSSRFPPHRTAHLPRLWIDAVCIDQEDLDERSEQVGVMGEIYTSSIGNVIYLGEDDGSFGRSCLDFRHLTEEIRQETNGFVRFAHIVFDRKTYEWRSLSTGLATKIDEEALLSFYSRPWFE